MKFLLVLLALLVLVLAGIGAYVHSGAYDVAATTPHWDMTHEFLEVVRDRSIAAHSEGISAPSLQDPKLVQPGLAHFHGMCKLCHGAPGSPRSEFAMGLYPSPPDLAQEHTQKKWNDSQLYWIVKNGLKMTGMPAFGPTHTDADLWGTIAVMRMLPQLKAEAYEGMIESAPPHGEHEEHAH